MTFEKKCYVVMVYNKETKDLVKVIGMSAMTDKGIEKKMKRYNKNHSWFMYEIDKDIEIVPRKEW